MKNTGLIMATVMVAAAPILAGPIHYHENWDSYATGLADPTYNAVWEPEVTVNPEWNTISTIQAFTPPNSLLLESRTRGLDNDLTDGIDNTGIGGVGFEMGADERVYAAGDLGDPENLQLGYYHRIPSNRARRNIATYVEASSGDVHAPWGANALDPLAAPIPVMAVGKLNELFTSSGGADGENVAVYFFNGQQWVRTALGTGTNYNRYWLRLHYNSTDGKWQAQIREDRTGQANVYDMAAGVNWGNVGFTQVGWRQINGGGSGWSGTSVSDDIYLDGGKVLVPLALDILPHTDPNNLTVNLKGKGRLPMAILGSAEIPASEIDVDSLSIAGGLVAPVKEPSADKDENGDGLADLVIHVSRRDLILALGLDLLDPGTVVDISVEGLLLDGRGFIATDSVILNAP